MNDEMTDKLDDLMDRYVFGLLDRTVSERVRRKIESEPEWQVAYEAAVRRKQILVRSVRAGAEEAVVPHRFDAHDVAAGARRREGRDRRQRRVFGWTFGGLAAAAALVIACAWIWAASIQPPAHVVRLIGQAELLAGSDASLRAVVTRQDDGARAAGVPVRLILHDARRDARVVLADWRTDDLGNAAGPVHVPYWPGGDYALIAQAGPAHRARIEAPIVIQRAFKVYLATDKPIYQPGQIIHMRCLVLRKPGLVPHAGEAVEFSVTDPADNVIFRQQQQLSEFGIASADLPLDELVNPGRYVVKVAAGRDSSEQTVEIFHYKLPAFAVKLSLDSPYYLPGQMVTGRVEVRYHFRQPVSDAKVELELTGRYAGAAEVFRKATATTDAQGAAVFRMELPQTVFGSVRTAEDAHLLLAAAVRDAAGQENTAYRTVVVARQDIRIAAVPENGFVNRGIEARLFLVTSYPDGRPAETIVDVQTLARSVRTDEAGVAVIVLRDVPERLRISARDAAGRTGQAEVALPGAEGGAFVLRTDRPVCTAGDTLAVEVVADRPGEVFLDVLQDRQAVLTKTLTVGRDGRARLAVDLPAELAGTLRLHAYRLDSEGEWVGRDLLVIVRPARRLSVAVTADRDVYPPGEDARLTFNVADQSGRPTAAALSLAAVDEAVYSVHQAAPGLAQTLVGLDEELLRPAVQAHGFSLALLPVEPRYAEAVLAAAAPQPKPPSRLRQLERQRLIPPDLFGGFTRNQIRQTLQMDPELRERIGPELAAELIGPRGGVHSLDCDSQYESLDRCRRQKERAAQAARKATAIGFAAIVVATVLLVVSWPADPVGRPPMLRHPLARAAAVTWVKVLCVALIVIVASSFFLPSLSRVRELARRATVAGGLRTLESAVEMVEADRSLRHRYLADVPLKPVDLTETGKRQPPRVRTCFPETMLWRPQVITDASGRAELTVPLADSITTWRLSGSAVSKAGQLGAVDSAIRVFQPFFVEIDSPPFLTAGDEVALPLVLYNYSGAELEVSLKAEGSGGLAVLHGAAQTVVIDSARVGRAVVTVRAEAAGEAALTVHASGEGTADAIRRSIRIAPPGVPQSLLVNGTVADGEQFVDLTVPPDAVPGSVAVRMKLYPSRFSELLDGLEGIFRMPYGCFEQTSSTTYPNVMAMAYMSEHGLGRPEVLARARQYIHLGYQRLLSFEVEGGGFSLFGQAPANVPLTAYGLMQFADMAKVHNVDPDVLSRTAGWLGNQQQLGGSWGGHLPMSHGPSAGRELAVTAYVTWAMAMHDPASGWVRRGAAYVAERLHQAQDAHTLALCANALLAAKDRAAVRSPVDRLAAMAVRSPDGCYWPGGGAALAYGGGLCADVETTALAALTLIREGQHRALALEALRWIASNRDASGTWGTTQSTVLALKSLLAGAGRPTLREEPAVLSVSLVEATGAAQPLGGMTVRPQQSDIVQSLSLDGLAEPGTYRLRLSARQAAGMPYQFVVRYYSQAPAEARAPQRPLGITVDYDRTHLEAGGEVTVRAVVTNHADRVATMLVADVGTPPGFTVRAGGLEKLQAAGTIDRYSLTPRGVIVYIGRIGPRQALSIEYKIVARMPLRAVAAPTTLYAYYDPDCRAVAAPAHFMVR